MPDMEDVRREVRKALLSDRFKEILLGVYEEKWENYGEDFQPEYIKEVWRSSKDSLASSTFPVAELTGTISRSTRPDELVIDLTHEIQIYVHERDDDEERLEDRLNRLMRAIRLYFEENQYFALIGNAPITLNDDVFSPFVPATVYEGRPWVKTGLVTMYVRTFG